MDTIIGRYRNVSILAAAIFFQVVGLAVQIKRHTEDDSTRLIRVWTVSAVTPFEKTIVWLQSGTSGIWHNYFYLRGVRQQNRDLQQQIQQMQLEQVRLRQDAEQARRLQSLLGFKEQFINKTVAAQVIGSSGSEQSRLVYIDKGSNDGIKNDMPVITASGVVGKVSNVINGNTAQVLLINDQNSGVGTILEQSRLQGVLKGKASGQLVLDKIMAEEEVKQGDRVLTSGGDQIFPKGLPVGTVSDIRRGGEFLQVTIKPAAALNHLEEVLVITQKLEREPSIAGNAQVRAADILAQRLPSVPDAPPAGSVNQAGGASGANTTVRPQASTGIPASRAAAPAGLVPAKPLTKPQPETEASKPATGAPVQSKPQTAIVQAPISQNSASAGSAKPASSAGQPNSQAAPGTIGTHLVPAAVPIKTTLAQPNSAPSQSKQIPSGVTSAAPAKAIAGSAAKTVPTKPANAPPSKPAANTSQASTDSGEATR
jgi:rod shape-determining protein MreC